MDSTDHTHLQQFCDRRKQNKTVGLHKKEYIGLYTKHISLKSLTEKKFRFFGTQSKSPRKG